ncbi:exopolysaccharide production negative regulator isoform X1 [Wolffia australiana]
MDEFFATTDHSGGRTAGRCDRVDRRRVFWLFRSCFTVALSIMASGSLSFLLGMLALPVSISSQCRIVSSGVDLRSSKVCELALPNCNSKYSRYPLGKPKIICHDDYYWASVFNVEYKEYFSGRMIRGVAESPKEALPIHCRPNFNKAWLTKSKFKVNETYNCSYSLGTFKADVHPDHLFNCPEDAPSVAETTRRMLSLLKSFYWNGIESWAHVLAVATGSLGWLVSSMLVVSTVQLLFARWLSLTNKLYPLKQQISVLAMQIRRPCILLFYVSAVGWLVLQYIQTVGLKQLLVDSLSRMAVMR